MTRYKVVPYFDGWAIIDTAYLFGNMVAFPFAHKETADVECAILNAKHERMIMQVNQTNPQQSN